MSDELDKPKVEDCPVLATSGPVEPPDDELTLAAFRAAFQDRYGVDLADMPDDEVRGGIDTLERFLREPEEQE